MRISGSKKFIKNNNTITPVKNLLLEVLSWVFILAIFCHGTSFDDLKAQVNVQSIINLRTDPMHSVLGYISFKFEIML